MNIDLDSPKPQLHDYMRQDLSFTGGTAAEKNEFLGSMGHELRNPLTNILAQVETLVEGIYGPLADAQITALTAIQGSAKLLLQLVSDVVDLGRIEAGAHVREQTSFMVNEKCASSVNMVAQLAHARSIQIFSEVEPPNLRVVADGRRIQQMITELLAAAILSVPTGGLVRLHIADDEGGLHLQTLSSASQTSTGSGHLLNEDAGISHHLLNRLGKVKPIGLALLQKLVHLHQGSFAVRETSAQEVSMSIRLPLNHLPASAAAPAEDLPETFGKEEPPVPVSSNQPTILIADDQPALITVTRNYLESLGFQVITARDGREAVHQASTLQPDLILMDVRMPVLDGLNAIQQIRSSPDPKTRGIAIISLSGHASVADKEKCLAAGATAYLNKPFGVRELDRIIADYIRPQES